MPQLIDTHAHLYLDQFDEDREVMLQRSTDAGVSRILLPNIDSSTTESLLRTVQAHPTCLPMMGLHPCSVKESAEDELKHVQQQLATGIYIAVGEIGIDLYWDSTFHKEQVSAFERQMDWAMELDLPVAIHCRDSFSEIFTSVEKMQDGRLRGVLHCFTGNSEQAKRVIGLGLHIGLGGVLTFKNSGLDRAIRDIPMDNLILETDAPYLAPAPHRGKRNESSYTRIIAEKLAEIKQLSFEEVARITTANARMTFGI